MVNLDYDNLIFFQSLKPMHDEYLKSIMKSNVIPERQKKYFSRSAENAFSKLPFLIEKAAEIKTAEHVIKDIEFYFSHIEMDDETNGHLEALKAWLHGRDRRS